MVLALLAAIASPSLPTAAHHRSKHQRTITPHAEPPVEERFERLPRPQHKGPAGAAHRSAMRPVDAERPAEVEPSTGDVSVPVSVPVSVSPDKQAPGMPTEFTYKVHHQTATCSDDQCPRGKFLNIGYLEKGYNLIYGNPMPEFAGIDPGFTRAAGAPIFKLEYNTENITETVDGRFEIPYHTIAYNEFACSLESSSKEVKSEQEYTAYLREFSEEEVGADVFLGPQVSYAGSREKSQTFNYGFANNHRFIFSSAECLAYRAELPKYGCRPGYSDEFLAAGQKLQRLADALTEGGEKKGGKNEHAVLEEWFNFFDTFGTHTFSDIAFGSRFTVETTMNEADFSQFEHSDHKSTIEGGVVKENILGKCGMDCKALDATLDVAASAAKAKLGALERGHSLERLDPVTNLGLGLSASGSSGNEGEKEAAQSWSNKRINKKIISIGRPPKADEIEWAKKTSDNPMPVRYRLTSICATFGTEKGEAETCTQKGFKRFAGGEALKEWCIKAMTPANYCVRRVAHQDPSVSCAKPFERFAMPKKCTTNTHCGTGYECIRKECKPSYARVTDIQAVMLGVGDENSAEPCSTKVLGNKKAGYEPVKMSGDVDGVTADGPANLYAGYGYETGLFNPMAGMAANLADKDVLEKYEKLLGLHEGIQRLDKFTKTKTGEFSPSDDLSFAVGAMPDQQLFLCVKKQKALGDGICEIGFGNDLERPENLNDVRKQMPENAKSRTNGAVSFACGVWPDHSNGGERSQKVTTVGAVLGPMGPTYHGGAHVGLQSTESPLLRQCFQQEEVGPANGQDESGWASFNDAKCEEQRRQSERDRFQSTLCVSYQGCEALHDHHDCIESVKFDCRTGEQLEPELCNNDDRKAPIAENEGGHCMCQPPLAEGKTVPPDPISMGQVTCGLHPDTTCQERCAGKDRGSAISDIVVHARRESDEQGEDCPEGFREVLTLQGVDGLMVEPGYREFFDEQSRNGLNPINYDKRTIGDQIVRFTLCVRHADNHVQESARVANDFDASKPL